MSELGLISGLEFNARQSLSDCVAKVENRTTPKISQKLILGLLCGSVAFQSRQEGPWSILDEAIWSLTSPRVKRISGSKNFRSTPQKDFCNNIISLLPRHNGGPRSLVRLLTRHDL
jgi:hypothetical protein